MRGEIKGQIKNANAKKRMKRARFYSPNTQTYMLCKHVMQAKTKLLLMYQYYILYLIYINVEQ